MSKLNFNKILWEAPIYDGVPGFLPSDRFYDEICEWLNSLDTIYSNREYNVMHCMKSQEDSDYDVVVAYNLDNRMIHYHFQKIMSSLYKERVKMGMTGRTDYLDKLFEAYNAGRISAEAYDAALMNIDEFCEEDDDEDL